MSSVIVAMALYTDFGAGDHYQGQMRAVLHSRLPSMPVFDLMTQAPRCQPKAAGYLLAAILCDVPDRTMVVAVVDPGVGSERQALMIHTERHILLGPDNGLLALAARRAAAVNLYRIDWRPERLSSSFHGRDLFAPVAAMLVTGEAFEATRMACEAMVGWDWPDDLGEVIHVDHYGNLITGIRSSQLPTGRHLHIAGHDIIGARTFSDVPPGRLFWYENSSGLVEIACNGASAAERLRVGVGEGVVLAA